jgi:hypothetical protein
MDISMPPLAPRAAPDLRPAADAVASARITRPAATMVVADPALISATQMGLVNQSLIGTEAQGVARVQKVEAVERVLKPFGVSMLPSREKREHEAPEGEEAGMGPGTDAAEHGSAGAAAREASDARPAPPPPERPSLPNPVESKADVEPEPA